MAISRFYILLIDNGRQVSSITSRSAEMHNLSPSNKLVHIEDVVRETLPKKYKSLISAFQLNGL